MKASAVDVESASSALKALGHPARLSILKFIADRCEPGCCATERAAVSAMARELGLSQPTVSHHLKELRHAGLVDVRRARRGVECRINTSKLRELAQMLQSPLERMEVFVDEVRT